MTMYFVLYAIIQIKLDRYMLSLMVPVPNAMRYRTCIVYDMLLMHQDSINVHPSSFNFMNLLTSRHAPQTLLPFTTSAPKEARSQYPLHSAQPPGSPLLFARCPQLLFLLCRTSP